MERSLAKQESSLTKTGPAEPLMVTPQYVENTKRSLSLLRRMVQEVLILGVDYGKLRGTPRPGLWEPGALQIISSFNCHVGQRRILSLVDEADKIAVVIEVPIISNNNGMEVGSGIGASSTNEARSKYRWVDDPKEWGYDEAAVATLKRDERFGRTQWQIVNPERDQLLHNMIKAASKRAEVDAAEAMPGAASALRELFDPPDREDDKKEKKSDTEHTAPAWTKFWSAARDLGYPDGDSVHSALKVKSMDDWMRDKKSLDDAIKELARLKGQDPKQPQVPGTQAESWRQVKPENIKSYDDLEKVYTKITGKTARDMYRELGGNDRNDMTIAAKEALSVLIEFLAPTK